MFFRVCVACCIFVFPSLHRSDMEPDMSLLLSNTCSWVSIGVSAIFRCNVPNVKFGLSGKMLKLYFSVGSFNSLVGSFNSLVVSPSLGFAAV